MNKKTVIVVFVFSFLFISAVPPGVMAQQENYVTENELNDLIENINNYRSHIENLLGNKVTSGQFENLSQAFQRFKENAITQSQLESEINSLNDDISSQFSDISEQLDELKQEKKGESLMLMAYGQEMKFLTFGGFGGGGSMNPLMLMMSGDGGISSMFQMKKISTDTPVLIMNNNMEMVGNAEINAYARGENGVVPINIPTAQGMTFFPIKGRVFGSVSAPNYEETSFFIQVGEGGYSPGGGGGQQAEVNFNDHLFQANKSNVVSITRGGNPVELDTISASGPDVVSSHPLPSQGKIQFSVGSEGMYTIRWMVDGQSKSRTFATEGYGAGGGSTNRIPPYTLLAIAIVVVVGILSTLHIKGKIDMKKYLPFVEEEETW